MPPSHIRRLLQGSAWGALAALPVQAHEQPALTHEGIIQVRAFQLHAPGLHDGDIELARAETGLSGTLRNGWDWSAAYEWHDREWQDARLRLRWGDDQRHALLIGQFKPFQSLDVLQSTRTLDFIGRAPVSEQIALSRRLGVGYQYTQPRWQLSAAHVRGNLDRNEDTAAGYVLRATALPWQTATSRLHLGISHARHPMVSSGWLDAADAPSDAPDAHTTGIETAWLLHNVKLQGEWLRSTRIDDTEHAAFARREGHVASLAWIISGEPWEYADGRPQPPEASRASSGLWQLGWRHARMLQRLDDGRGDTRTDATVALSANLERNWKVTLQHQRTRFENGKDTERERLTELQWQWHW